MHIYIYLNRSAPSCKQVFTENKNVKRSLLFFSSTAKISLILKARNCDMSRKCPTCDKTVYMGEKKESLGNWYHPLCLKCRKCGRQLAVGSHAERKGEPYCHNPCYASEFGPGGFGHGGTESHKY